MIISDLSLYSFRKLARVHDFISVRQLFRVEFSYSGDGFSGYVFIGTAVEMETMKTDEIAKGGVQVEDEQEGTQPCGTPGK